MSTNMANDLLNMYIGGTIMVNVIPRRTSQFGSVCRVVGVLTWKGVV